MSGQLEAREKLWPKAKRKCTSILAVRYEMKWLNLLCESIGPSVIQSVSANPKGIVEHSPGLARLRAYPGSWLETVFNPKAGCGW